MNLNFNPLDLLTTEPLYTYKLLEEYLGTIDKYKNISRTAVPIRVIVPDEEKSVYHKKTDLSYDREISGLTGYVYKVYEYVPAYYSSPVSFSVMEGMDVGVNLKASPISVSLIGFGDITIGSFVSFYSELFERALFEVTNFRTPLFSNLKVPVFDLDLILIDLNLKTFLETHKISKVYFYDYTLEKFLDAETFKKKVETLQSIQKDILPVLQSAPCFSQREETYKITNDREKNIKINALLLELINKINKNYFRLNLPIPFNSEILKKRKEYEQTDAKELVNNLKNLLLSNLIPSNPSCFENLKALLDKIEFLLSI